MNPTGIWTIVKREVKRTYKIVNQVVWPPIISALLYAFVFGFSLGSKIQEIDGMSYLTFLIPGLIMMTVIENSYGEGSASLFIAKFMNSIQEMLIAPLAYAEIVTGYIIGGIIRGVGIGTLIYLVTLFLFKIPMHNIFLFFAFMILVSILFSSIGTVMALWANTFDDLAVLGTFVITPLVFLGGVFHSISLLPETFQIASKFNPIFYMIDGFRYSITGIGNVPIAMSLGLVILFTVIAYGFAVLVFSSGYKIKE